MTKVRQTAPTAESRILLPSVTASTRSARGARLCLASDIVSKTFVAASSPVSFSSRLSSRPMSAGWYSWVIGSRLEAMKRVAWTIKGHRGGRPQRHRARPNQRQPRKHQLSHPMLQEPRLPKP